MAAKIGQSLQIFRNHSLRLNRRIDTDTWRVR
jgi:hypothetical protein